jgi:hypothetical protein
MLAIHPDLGLVIGVDTHNDTHTAAAVGATGAVLEHLTIPAGGLRCRTDHGTAGSLRAGR